MAGLDIQKVVAVVANVADIVVAADNAAAEEASGVYWASESAVPDELEMPTLGREDALLPADFW